ncbi:MAG TPA: hypothetical protein PKH33_02685 [bacterium]|nr:hypothetical protein [bacterium]
MEKNNPNENLEGASFIIATNIGASANQISQEILCGGKLRKSNMPDIADSINPVAIFMSHLSMPCANLASISQAILHRVRRGLRRTGLMN